MVDLTRSIETAGLGQLLLSVNFEQAGINIAYVDPGDVKASGLVMTRQLFVPYGSEYDDEIDVVVDALNALLLDALEDFPRLPAIAPSIPDEEDDC